MNGEIADFYGDDGSDGEQGEASERRIKPRISGFFPAIVRGVDAQGRTFQENAYLDNVSANGLYVKIPRSVAEGMKLFVVFPFPTAIESRVEQFESAPQVAVRGTIRRIETQPDGLQGI